MREVIKMEDILEYIRNAPEDEIDALAELSLNRKRQLHPDWEIHYIALAKRTREEYCQSLQYAIRMMMLELQAVERGEWDIW